MYIIHKNIFCRLNNFWKFNRNLRRIVSNERDDLRTRLLKSGRLACVSALDEWPRTLHERRTFTVDLTIFTVSTSGTPDAEHIYMVSN